MSLVWHLSRIVHLTALAAWFAAMVTAGIAAINVFGRLPRMHIELPQYSALPTDEHGRLAAGMVMQGVFTTCDAVQLVAVPLAVLTLIVQLVIARPGWRSLPDVVRSACVLAAGTLFAIHITAVAPPMYRHLHEYWSALEQRQTPDAQSHLSAFNKLHPVGDGLLKVNLVLILTAIGATAVASARPRCRPVGT